MVNSSIQGRVYGPTPAYLVGREKVSEFARAVQATAAIHYDVAAAQAAGYSDVVATPTFPVVVQEKTLALLLADESANIDFSRVVHGDQQFSYQRPIVAGDQLSGTLTVLDVKQLGGNFMIRALTELTDTAGKLVAQATSTLVVRGGE